MLTRLGKFARQLRRRFSRSHLLMRWLGYEVQKQESQEPGLIILQIDGLSRKQFEAAVAKNRLPYLRKLLRRDYCARVSFYSGLPSTTPAVQAEVMYGRKCVVPAFQFLHRKSGQVFRMFDQEAAKTIVEERLKDAEPLLQDGASFANIYSGGAQEARLCAETTDLPNVLKQLNPLRMLLIFFLYFFTLIRIAWLAGVELIVAIGDMIRGVISRRDWKKEIKYVPSRVLVSVVLREWVRIVVKLSIEQGKPVIYGNFLGYDEQSHRRGPSAAFAHWGLKGIDRVIEDIFKSAKRSDSRDYEVVVFSDHGQEETKIYEFETGHTIQDAVKRSLQVGPLGQHAVQRVEWETGREYLDQRMRHLMRIRRGQMPATKFTMAELAENVIVTAMGPLGYIYYPMQVTEAVKADCAKYLVERENVPLVLYRTDEQTFVARNAQGLWKIPEDIGQICGEGHPFIEEITEDLVCLCQSENAGDVIISGWNPKGHSLSFVQENGAHGSLGEQETRGFALIPKRIPFDKRQTPSGEAYLRGVDLYQAGISFLGRAEKATPRFSTRARAQTDAPSSPQTELRFRVLTYNTHHCVGLDGKCRPHRIAEVIDDLDPDIVALQEMDVNRHRSGKQDQTRAIALRLGMEHHFFPVWSGEAEQYGLAILSKLPFKVIRESYLTEACHRTKSEARGAIWVRLEPENFGPIHLLNTHLGLRAAERQRQVEELLGERWLSDLDLREPVIIAGDFNAGPESKLMKNLTRRFYCAQVLAENHKPQKTFASMLPLRRLDYILVSSHFRVNGVLVPKNHFTCVASDHLPLCADLVLKPDVKSADSSPQAIIEETQDGFRLVDASR